MPRIKLYVEDIYFLQDSINSEFQDGTHLLDVFQDLLEDEISPSDFPDITVVKHRNNLYFAFDGNRRLYLFKVRQNTPIQQSTKHKYACNGTSKSCTHTVISRV